MPRLKLDIFSNESHTPEEAPTEKPKTAQASDKELSRAIHELPTRRLAKAESPKFIPVGFTKEDLLLLDQAIFALRRSGHFRASKSGIVRALIALHRDDLVRLWLSKNAENNRPATVASGHTVAAGENSG